MIYQFEHEEIKRCRECPCHSWADFPDEKDWCDLQDKQLAYDTEPEYNNCPLVAISKTETTNCELLNHNMNYKKCSSCNHLIHVYVNKPNYCPNCGRKIRED